VKSVQLSLFVQAAGATLEEIMRGFYWNAESRAALFYRTLPCADCLDRITHADYSVEVHP